MAAQSSAWSLRVDTVDEAKKMIRESAMGFYAIAAIQAVVALVLGLSMLVDAILFATFALWLQRTNSRIAATLLLLLSAIAIVTTAINKFGSGPGGRNIMLSLIILWLALRAAIATYKLPRLAAQAASAI